MRALVLAGAVVLAAGAAQAAGLVEINPDAKGGQVVGNAGGVPDTRRVTAFGADPRKQPAPEPPRKEKTPPAVAP